MTTRQPILPRAAPGGQPDPKEYYLTPRQVPYMRNTDHRPGPRIQTMPPTSDDPIGIYSYLDQENMDDIILTKTLEAIESGEFTQIPQEIMTWYNSITQNPAGTWEDDSRLKEQNNRYEGKFETRAPGHEYIDLSTDKLSAPPEDYEETEETSKRNKRFLKGDKMNFIKDRLSQFLNNNFKGNKKREEPKKSETISISDPVDKYCSGVLVTSNSFDNFEGSLEYMENPKRRSSTEAFIAQQVPPRAPKDDSCYTYLGSQESNIQRDTARHCSKSLENVFIPLQPPTPTPLEKLKHEDPYLSPINILRPTPPPRISSRQKEPPAGLCFDLNLTQDYIEPRVLSAPPIPKTSVPTSLLESPRDRLPHSRNRSTGSKPTEYILPEDTPVTPMMRFSKDPSLSSIPVLSSGADYNDPLDFNLSELRQAQSTKRRSPHSDSPHTKPIILPKPCLPRMSSTNDEYYEKPTPPPKPARHSPRKPHKSNLPPETSSVPLFSSHTRSAQPVAKIV